MFFDDVDVLNPLADHPLNDGLVSLYLAMPNTGGANRFYDVKGTNHGNFVGNAFWYWDAGHAAPLLYIASGTQDGVQLDSVMALTSPFTIAAWVYPTTLTANSCIAGNYDGGNYWIFRQAATDGTKWEFSRNAENLFLAGAANTVTQNAWQLVVATWDGTNWVLYKNEASIATNSSGTGPANGTQTYLARLPAGFNWNGLFGAFWHYERFFSEIDAYSLWQQCLQGFPDIIRRNPDPWSFGVQAAAAGNPWNYYAQAA